MNPETVTSIFFFTLLPQKFLASQSEPYKTGLQERQKRKVGVLWRMERPVSLDDSLVGQGQDLDGK